MKKGLELAQVQNEKLWEARLWGYRGMCLTRLGNTHFAQIALYKSHNLARELENKPLLIDALTQLGSLHMDAGHATKAISKLELALGHAMALNDQPRIMHLAGKLGQLFLQINALEKAVEYFDVALQAATSLSQWPAVWSYKLSLGNVYRASQQYATAQELYEEALSLAGELSNPQAELSSLSSLMQTHVAMGNRSSALLYGESALRLAREIGDLQQEIADINLLTAFLLEREQFQKSLPLLRRGLEIARSGEDWNWQLTMQERLGYTHHQLGQLAEALAAYTAAQETALQLQDPAAAALLYGRLSAVLADQGATADAIHAAEQALKLGRDQESWPLVGEQQVFLAFAHAELGNIAQAIACCQEAITAFQNADDTNRREKAEALLLELRAMSTAD